MSADWVELMWRKQYMTPFGPPPSSAISSANAVYRTVASRAYSNSPSMEINGKVVAVRV